MNPGLLLPPILASLALAAPAQASVTIGLTGGAPKGVSGQALVAGAGVSVMSWAGNQTPADPLVPQLRLKVNLRDSLSLPALGAQLWGTQDEPWLNHVDPAFTQQQVDVIHAAGGTAITNQGWGMDTAPTRAALSAYPGDILSVDTYPTPQHPYAEMARKVALMHSVARGRPVWAALQVCSRSNFGTGRPPSAAVEWEMARRALDNGATGILFFGAGYQACFQSAQDRATGFNWSAWRSTIMPTIRRIRAYHRALVQGMNGATVHPVDLTGVISWD